MNFVYKLSQYVLAEQEMTLKTKNEAADKLIGIVGAENEFVQKEKLIGKMTCLTIQTNAQLKHIKFHK